MSLDRNAPIGVFDSGVGGLTVVREIMRNCRAERIVYFGDTARGALRKQVKSHSAPLFPPDCALFKDTGSKGTL